jgi:glucose-1-phosphate adenylyltransferase
MRRNPATIVMKEVGTMTNILAVVLAGGRGKRMDILCHLRPKPTLPFAGRFRVIDFCLSNCLHSGIRQTAVLVDYQRCNLSRYLRQWQLSNGEDADIDVLEPKDRNYKGTADAVYQNIDYINRHTTDSVLIVAADHVYKMDYTAMLDYHRIKQADVTLAVVPVPIEESNRFGIVKAGPDGRITDFIEKPKIPQSNMASMSIYIFNKDLLLKRLKEDTADPHSSHDFGHSIIPRMLHSGDKIFAYIFRDYWQDVGSIAAYYSANMEIIHSLPSFSLNTSRNVLTADKNVAAPKIVQTANIKTSIISPGCIIKGNVENSILSPGVMVEEKAVVKNSVILSDSFIGDHSIVERCIVDEDVSIGKFCYMGFGSTLMPGNWDITVIGKGVTVPSYTAIGRNCKVLPNVTAADFTTNAIPSGTTIS